MKLDAGAKHLLNLYILEKARLNNKRYLPKPTDTKVLQHFQITEDRLKKNETESLLKINRERYISAHFKFFGKRLYPSQLHCSFSLDLYRTYESVHFASEIIYKPKDKRIREAKMLSQLADARGESEYKTLKYLSRWYEFGCIFSKKFLKSRGF